MPTFSDDTFAWLRGLGYSGTMLDMEYSYLKDLCTDASISPVGSHADLETLLGLPHRDVIIKVLI